MLYQLYTNQVYQREYINWLEEQVKEALAAPREWHVDTKNDMDFSDYLRYLDQARITMERLESYNRFKHPKFPLWYGKQRAVDAIVEVSVDNIPLHVSLSDGNPSSSSIPIEIAYAKDEHGHVMGFEQFSSAKDEGKETDTLTLYLRVGHSNEITVYRIYKEKSQEEKQEGKDDATRPIVFQSQTIRLIDVARDSGIPEK
jgi:hypothetical protein